MRDWSSHDELDGKCLFPVIHCRDEMQVLSNAMTARECGCRGVFLIDHGEDGYMEVHRASFLKRMMPSWFWVGINRLGAHPNAVLNVDECVSGVWADDAGVLDDNCDNAELIKLGRSNSATLYFGGVAFKYRPKPKDLELTVRNARRYVDVITTSGPATGHPPDVDKIRTMHVAANGTPLALASGVSASNVEEFLPYVQYFLVATSICSDWHSFDRDKLMKLSRLIHD